MKTLLWLDDCRDPFAPGNTWIKTYSPIGFEDVSVIWVQNYDEFENYLEKYGIPDAVCFDHDLAEDSYDERDGHDCAKLLVEKLILNEMDMIPYAIQSSNPVGKERIQSVCETYHKYYLKYIKKND